MNLRKILAIALILLSFPGGLSPLLAVDVKLSSSSKVTHAWPEGDFTFHTSLDLYWDWQPEPENVWHGRITKVVYVLQEGATELHRYESSATSPAISQLPVEVAGYAALVGAELRFQANPAGGVQELLNANEFTSGWLTRLGAPNTPIREKILKILGPQFTPEALRELLEEMLLGGAELRRVPGFPNLVESTQGKGNEITLNIQPDPEAPPHIRDLGAAKVQMDLAGNGTANVSPAPSGIFPLRKSILRTLQGSATVVEKRPDWAEMPGSWPVSIELQTTVELSLVKESPSTE